MLEVPGKNDARLLYASSSEVYGDPEVFTTPESYEGRVDALGPRSCYEEGKRFGEALCKAFTITGHIAFSSQTRGAFLVISNGRV